MTPLFVDVYPGDGRKDWTAFCAAGPPWHGVIFKASQGLRYSYLEWLTHNRNQLRDAAGDRFGVDLFDGMYHFLDLAVDGAAQADFFMKNCEASGGERVGTLWGMVDVERGGQAPAFRNPSRALVEDRVRSFAERYQQLTGRAATLYGGELLRSVGVQDRLGCARSAIALYSAELRGSTGGTADLLRRTGTDLEHLLLWQYRGTEPQEAAPHGLPMVAPGCGERVDINALTWPGGLAAVRAGLWAERPPISSLVGGALIDGDDRL
jgi:hypothetical protein